jgi:hypothetical protein
MTDQESSIADTDDRCCLQLPGLQVAMLVEGLPTLIASPLGGYLCDKSAAAHPGLLVARMAPNTLVLLLLMPASAVGLAWSLQYHAHLAIPLVAAVVLNFAGCFHAPAMLSYITTVKQSTPSAATCGLLCIINLVTGFVLAAGAIIRKAMGVGWWLTCLASVQLVVTAVVDIMIVRQMRAYRAAALNMPPAAGTCTNNVNIDVMLPMEAAPGQLAFHMGSDVADKDCVVHP